MKENQHALNQRIEQLIQSKDQRGEKYTKEDMALLQSYEGAGGQGAKGAKGEGLLYEFYTPDYIVALMWKLAHAHGYDGGAVLEPSIGTGRMIAEVSDKTTCVGFETNPVSVRIAQILHPNATIYNDYFETAFLEPQRFTSRLKKQITWLKEYPFSLVIGNPPFGVFKNKYSSYFPKPNFRQIETYFMYYGLEMLKSGGLLIYLTGGNFLRNGDSYNSAKEEIANKATLLDAYRLPSVFKSTQAPVDIIVLKKK